MPVTRTAMDQEVFPTRPPTEPASSGIAQRSSYKVIFSIILFYMSVYISSDAFLLFFND